VSSPRRKSRLLESCRHRFPLRRDLSRSLFLIETGRTKVFSNDEEGKQTIFAFLAAGDYCGELSLLDAEPRSASVVALEKTVTLQLNYPQFDAFLKTHPELSYSIFRAL